MFHLDASQERRRSLNTLAIGEKWRPRSASTGIIDVSPLSRSFGSSQWGPATPCFVNPRMAFSTKFEFDSPIQVLTSSSPCVFKPMSVPSLQGRCSLKRLPHRCKILLSVLLLSFAACLYFIRNFSGSALDVKLNDCVADGTCDLSPDHPSLQRLLGSASGLQQYHTLTADLDYPYEEVPHFNDFGESSQFLSADGNSDITINDFLDNTVDSFPEYSGKVDSEPSPFKVVGKDLEHNEKEDVDKDLFSNAAHQSWDENTGFVHSRDHRSDGLVLIESADISQEQSVSQNTRYKRSSQHMAVLENENYIGAEEQSYSDLKYMEEPFRYLQPRLSEREIKARMTKHTAPQYREERPGPSKPLGRDFDSRSIVGSYKRPDPGMNADGIQVPNRNQEGLRMNRLPPGINPRKYRTEF